MAVNSLACMATLKTPILSVVIGEGGSGGALAIGVGDHLIMLEFPQAKVTNYLDATICICVFSVMHCCDMAT